MGGRTKKRLKHLETLLHNMESRASEMTPEAKCSEEGVLFLKRVSRIKKEIRELEG